MAVNAEITSGVPGWSFSKAATSGFSTATSPAEDPCSQTLEEKPEPKSKPNRRAKSRRPAVHRRYASHGDNTIQATR